MKEQSLSFIGSAQETLVYHSLPYSLRLNELTSLKGTRNIFNFNNNFFNYFLYGNQQNES